MKELEWWKKTTVYQIFPASFKDTNGDGFGDIKGIIENLDYLQELGIETIWLNPIYKSPFKDAGYDISDYKAIDPKFGDMASCEKMLNEIHTRGMKIIFDLVLNHTSDQHRWFIESRSSRDNPKRDWYVWRDGKGLKGVLPPNNWRSLLGYSTGWHKDDVTKQWYWAHFFKFQPDLNYWNPDVRAEMLNTMRFWLDKGVDGFRLDFINGLFHDKEFRNNPFKLKLIPSSLSPEKLLQGSKFTLNRPETIAFMKNLRTVVDEYDPPRFLVGEAVTSPKMLKKYCGEEQWDGLHTSFLFGSLGVPLKSKPIKGMINEWEKLFPYPYIPTWVFSTHDRMRRITRLGNDITKAKANVLLQLTARGIPFIYYGEEIGIPQHDLPIKESADPVARNNRFVPEFLLEIAWKYFNESLNRDECRTPMQWTSARNCGFCPDDTNPWLPCTPTQHTINVEKERDDQNSLLNCYRSLLALRKEHPALNSGDFEFIEWEEAPQDLLAYKRKLAEKTDTIAIFLNCSDKEVEFNFPNGECNLIYSTRNHRTPIEGEQCTLKGWEGIITAKA